MHSKVFSTPVLLNIVVGVILLGLIIVVIAINYSSTSATLSRQMRTNSIPTAMLDNGKVGSILKQQGLVYTRDNPGERYPPDKSHADGPAPVPQLPSQSPFRRKRQVGDYLYQANSPGKRSFPSTRLATPGANRIDLPLLSIAASEKSLYGSEHGIIANPARTNRQWERPSTFSLFAGDRLVFAGNAGVRLAGSKFIRLSGDNNAVFDFELFFRNAYGVNTVGSKGFFNANGPDLTGMVIERNHPLKNDIALELADIAGLTTPRHHAALFQLNGGKQQLRLLREPVSQKQWLVSTGAAELDFYRGGDDGNDPGWNWYDEFGDWFVRISKEMTMSNVATYIDVENLTDTLVVMMFCGSADWQNWAIYRDRESHPYWQWIIWDLQTCFSDRWNTSPGKLSRQHWLEVVASRFPGENRLRHSCGDYRCRLFVGLMNQDPGYRDYFIGRMHHFLDKLAASTILQEKITRYSNLEPLPETGHDPDYTSMADVRDFIAERIVFLREEIGKFAVR